jgi:hypothetical protein
LSIKNLSSEFQDFQSSNHQSTIIIDLNESQRQTRIGRGPRQIRVASALFLKSRGARVTVSDAKSTEDLSDQIPSLLDQGIAV